MLLPLLGVVLVSGGCDRREPSPTAPEAVAAAGDPRQSIRLPGYVPVGTASIPLPALSGPGTDVGWTALGTVRVGEYVRVRVSGEITIRLNQAFVDEYCQGNPLSNAAQCGRLPEMIGAEGVSGGMLVVAARILYPDGDWVYVPLSPSPLFPSQRVGAWQARAEGVVEFMRTGHHWVHGGIPVFALEGSQSISMDVVREVPRLVVRCDRNAVVRGEGVECRATPEPDRGTFRMTGWRFDGGGFTIRPGAAGPRSALGEKGNEYSTWGGPMAVSGGISATAEIDGRTVTSNTVNVSVGPRTWSQRPVPEPRFQYIACEERTEACPLRYPPSEQRDMGQTSALYTYQYPVALIVDGPNESLAYISGEDSPISVSSITIYLSRVLSDARDPFWRSGTDCTLQVLDSHVREHELKHVQYIRDWVEGGEPAAVLEWQVHQATSGQAAGEWFDNFVETRIKPLVRQGGDSDHDNEYPPDPCRTGLPFRR